MCMTCDDTKAILQLLAVDDPRASDRYWLCVQADDGGVGRLVIPDGQQFDPMATFAFLVEETEETEGFRCTRMRKAAAGDDPSRIRCWLQVDSLAGAEWAYFLTRYAATLELDRENLTELGVLDAAVKALEKEALMLFPQLPELNRQALAWRDGTDEELEPLSDAD